MLPQDTYGLTVSCQPQALEFWFRGVSDSLSYDRSGIDHLTDAIKVDPNFALGYATLGHQQLVHGDRKQGLEAIKQAVKLSLLHKITEREISHINILSAVASYDPNALMMAYKHIERWPLDIAILTLITGAFGLLAFSGNVNWRTENLDLLKRNQQYYPEDDWCYLTTLAFALAETGELSSAEKWAERAWCIQPTGNCAHTLSHVHFETDALVTSKAFLNEWMQASGKQSDMRHHLQWHLALIDFEENTANDDLIVSRYQTELTSKVSDPMPLTTFSDNASFLWRCKLHDIAIPEEFILDISAYEDKHYPNIGFAFADIHKIMVTALQNSRERDQNLICAFAKLADEQNAMFFENVCRGFIAFNKRDYALACQTLSPLLKKSVMLGGSNPQRRIIEETYVESCVRMARENNGKSK